MPQTRNGESPVNMTNEYGDGQLAGEDLVEEGLADLAEVDRLFPARIDSGAALATTRDPYSGLRLLASMGTRTLWSSGLGGELIPL
jgi:hypothetical protein